MVLPTIRLEIIAINGIAAIHYPDILGTNKFHGLASRKFRNRQNPVSMLQYLLYQPSLSWFQHDSVFYLWHFGYFISGNNHNRFFPQYLAEKDCPKSMHGSKVREGHIGP